MAECAGRPDENSWVDDVCSKAGPERQPQLRAFLSQPACLRIIRDWIVDGERPELKMTDMCDLYKLSMCGVFERIQQTRPGVRVTFYLNVRPTSEAKLEHMFRPGQTRDTDIRDKWLREMHGLTTQRPFDVQCLASMTKAAGKGVVRLSCDRPEWALQLPAERVRLNVYLRNRRDDEESRWGRLVELPRARAADAPDPAFALVFETGKYAGRAGQVTIEEWATECGTDLEVIALAEGPWPIVTWFETSMMQATAEALASVMMRNRGWDDVEWYARALAQTMDRVDFLNSRFAQYPKYKVALFSGRRAPRKGFHLLHNLYLLQFLLPYSGTSSLFSYRVFHSVYDWLNEDGHWKKDSVDSVLGAPDTVKQGDGVSVRPLFLLGTHAHEGSMVFAGLCGSCDEEMGFPVSTLLWHLNYWLHTSNYAMLPDTYGSACFAHLMATLRFPVEWIAEFKRRHPGPKAEDLDPKASIYDSVRASEKRSRDLGAAAFTLVRQDSGTLEGFIANFPVKEFVCLASEIGGNEDIVASQELGYMSCGAGGYFGEKPWTKEDGLAGKLDLVAKVCRVREARRTAAGDYRVTEAFAMKLGDYKEKGKWFAEGEPPPGKLAVGPMVPADGRESLFRHYRHLGEVRGGAHANAQGPAKPFMALTPDDRQAKFEEMWKECCLV